jgi:hypothetical protein
MGSKALWLILGAMVTSTQVFGNPAYPSGATETIDSCYPKLVQTLRTRELAYEYGTESGERNWVSAKYDHQQEAVAVRTGLPLPATEQGAPEAMFIDMELDGALTSAAYFDGKNVHREGYSGQFGPISEHSHFMWAMSLGVLFNSSGICR